MSADSWGVCPRCKKIATEKQSATFRKAEKEYGKISSDEYIKLMNRATTPAILEDTLREDYEIRTDSDGCFSIGYYCHCDKCGFEHDFKHEAQLI